MIVYLKTFHLAFLLNNNCRVFKRFSKTSISSLLSAQESLWGSEGSSLNPERGCYPYSSLFYLPYSYPVQASNT